MPAVDSQPVDQPKSAPDGALVPLAVRATVGILIIDDERTLRESCKTVLEAEGYRVEVCGRGDEALNLVQRRRFDIVITDLYMSEVTGMELLQATLEFAPETIVIVMTGNPSVASNVEALKAGAWDYVPKPFSATHLQILIGRAAHAITVARESSGTSSEAEGALYDGLRAIGSSAVFKRVMDIARRVAATDASVFITGESGTGKELIAQTIHHHSRRRSRQLVAVNCAALPEGLLESEMFGHVKGAFTGAVREKAGLLEVANGGTLFLDEVIDMPKSVQAKLLRVIQDGVVRRVGSSTTSAVVNVRFISASNADPEEAVRDGRLREDLYYRLRVVPIHVPPLRERGADVTELATFFLDLYWRRHRGGDLSTPRLSEAALASFRSRMWQGNVRELQNAIEHAVVMLEPGQLIEPEDVPMGGEMRAGTSGDESADILTPDVLGQSYHTARERVLTSFERRYLSWLLARAGGNMSKAARLAGVDRTTLYRLMERHGLQRETITVLPE